MSKKVFCDKCGSAMTENYDLVFRLDPDWAISINTNFDDLCLKCVREIVANGKEEENE